MGFFFVAGLKFSDSCVVCLLALNLILSETIFFFW